jgi:hypothetical protein
MWYVVIGFLLTLLVGIIFSYIVNWCSKQPDTVPNPDLFAPLVRGYVKRKYRTKARVHGEDDVSLIKKYLYLLSFRTCLYNPTIVIQPLALEYQM